MIAYYQAPVCPGRWPVMVITIFAFRFMSIRNNGMMVLDPEFVMYEKNKLRSTNIEYLGDNYLRLDCVKKHNCKGKVLSKQKDAIARFIIFQEFNLKLHYIVMVILLVT